VCANYITLNSCNEMPRANSMVSQYRGHAITWREYGSTEEPWKSSLEDPNHPIASLSFRPELRSHVVHVHKETSLTSFSVTGYLGRYLGNVTLAAAVYLQVCCAREVDIG
jgi:hypothetical protein